MENEKDINILHATQQVDSKSRALDFEELRQELLQSIAEVNQCKEQYQTLIGELMQLKNELIAKNQER